MVKKEPVNVNWQTLFVFIPILDLWAAYRVQKLRMFLLIFLVGFGGASILIEIAFLENIDGMLELSPNYVIPDYVVAGIYISITVVNFVVAVILIRKWSKEWNNKLKSGA